jgi:hypothetical protein
LIWLWLALSRLLFLTTDSGGSDDDDAGDDGDGPGDGDPAGGGGDEEIRDPKAKIAALTEANGRLARRKKKLEARVSELERGTSNGGEALRSARLESAFLRAVMNSEQGITDTETAWDLLDARGFLDAVKIGDDGQVEGMDEAVERLLSRYPWLIEDEAEPPPERPTLPKSPRTPTRNKEVPSLTDRKTLEQRFSALRRGHH